MTPAVVESWAPILATESRHDTRTASLESYRPPDAPDDPPAVASREPAAAAAPRILDGESFEIIDKIGEGGFGVVYKAQQGSLGREVALKRVQRSDARRLAQFVWEARITGQLEHANIVPVHLLDRSPDGELQLAMKLVKGSPWSQLIHAEHAVGLDLKGHLDVLLAICNAVAFAHTRGVIHRDLKPANVMVGEFGQVFVMDWGLAIRLDAKPTRMGPSGTPSYMAPELASGSIERQDERTDVYLLGACLHELLTRRRLHEGSTVYNVLVHAIESPPPVFDDSVPRELADVCRRAVAAEPADRYASVEELRAAIEAYLEHREANAAIEKGLILLRRLRETIAAAEKAPAAEREAWSRDVHALHAEVRFGLQHALDLWPGADHARAALRESTRIMLEHALCCEDLPLALRLVPDCEIQDLRDRVDRLRRRAEARERELDTLRATARRHDWRFIARPLGTVFIVAAVLGLLGAALSRQALEAGPAHWAIHPRTPWVALVAIIGGFAFFKVRTARVPDSVVSPRMLGVWAAVAIGCAATGITAELRGQPPFRDACYQAFMVAIGFAGMGFETKRWLLLPAAAFFAVGMVMAAWPRHNPEIFGAVWFVTFTAVGVMLRRSARERSP
jgi:hypothetical protein